MFFILFLAKHKTEPRLWPYFAYLYFLRITRSRESSKTFLLPHKQTEKFNNANSNSSRNSKL